MPKRFWRAIDFEPPPMGKAVFDHWGRARRPVWWALVPDFEKRGYIWAGQKDYRPLTDAKRRPRPFETEQEAIQALREAYQHDEEWQARTHRRDGMN